MNQRIFLSLPLAVFFLTNHLSAQNSVVVTYAESPDDVYSRLPGTAVFDFNKLLQNSTQTDVVWEGVGVFDEVHILAPDAYGGAPGSGYSNGSPYLVQGDFVGVNTTTLSLYSPHAYFGFWWSAGDATNILDFYNGSTLVAHFSTATLLDLLATSPDYLGHPLNRARNHGENYAFINFFGQEGTTWDRIVLSNPSNSGFESDNFTDRAAAWSFATDGAMPGITFATVNGTTTTIIPEARSSMIGLLGAVLLLFRRRS